MAWILHLETATKKCSVALAKEGKTIAYKEIAEENFSHAENLHVFIEQVLKENQLHYKNLNAIAISQGPGSYTGLRIGVSTAKGLCFALDIPLIAIDTLLLLAKQVLAKKHELIIPMIDARRMEVYTAIYDANYTQKRNVLAEIITKESFAEITETIHLVGDGATKCKNILTAKNFIYHDQIIFPSAQEMSALSFEKYTKKQFENVAYFEPFYLKDFLIK